MEATALDRTRSQALATGVFSALDNQVDVQTGTVRAKARFANADGKLFPSQFVNLRLQVNLIEDAVVVPVTALRHGANGDFVYVLNAKEKTVSMRPRPSHRHSREGGDPRPLGSQVRVQP